MKRNDNSQNNKNSSTTPSIADVFTKRAEDIKESIRQENIEQTEAGSASYQLLSPSHGEYAKLLAEIPEGRKHKGKYGVMRKIAHLLVNNEKVENYRLAQVIYGNVRSQRGKLKRFAKYEYNDKHHQKVKNHLVALKRCWKPLGFTITLRCEYSKIIPIR